MTALQTTDDLDISERIAAAPMTRFQIRAVVLCFLLNMVDGFDVLVMPFTAPVVSEEWHISNVFLGYLLSASLFGMAFGSFVITPFADRVGRRAITLICLGIATLGMALSCIATGPTFLMATRVLAGIGIGGMISNLGVIVSEYSNRASKALVTGAYTAGYPIGAVIGGVVAEALTEAFGWRSAFAFGAGATAILALACVAWLPESYQYLLVRRGPGSLDRLNAILRRTGQEPVQEMPVLRTAPGRGNVLEEVFGRARLSQTLLMWLGYSLLTTSFYFANSWTTKIIAEISHDKGMGVTTGIMFNLGGALGSVLFGVFALRRAPRIVQIGTLVLAACFYALFGLMVGNVGAAMVVGVFAGLLVTGSVAGVYTLGPALYPADVRAAGMGWLIGIGRLTSIIAPILAGYLLNAGIAPSRVFQMFAIPLLVSAFAFFLLGRVRVARGLPADPTHEAKL